jgi:hypothetical protein
MMVFMLVLLSLYLVVLLTLVLLQCIRNLKAAQVLN